MADSSIEHREAAALATCDIVHTAASSKHRPVTASLREARVGRTAGLPGMQALTTFIDRSLACGDVATATEGALHGFHRNGASPNSRRCPLRSASMPERRD